MADHKDAKIRAIEVSKPKYKGTSLEGENILAAAYLELRELAKAVAHSQMDEESRWPEMRALRAAIGEE